MTNSEQFSLAGIPIEGAAAQLGRLVEENILYAAAVKQLRRRHRPTRDARIFDCTCGEHPGGCPELAALSILDRIKGSQ